MVNQDCWWKEMEKHFFFMVLILLVKKIKDGVIDIDALYRQLEGRLHSNAPHENWPDPKSTAGMVTIQYKDKTEKGFLIFDEEEFAESLFSKVKDNIVDSLSHALKTVEPGT